MKLFAIMIPFIDFHSHHAAKNETDLIVVQNILLQDLNPEDTFPFSTGLHPWHVDRYNLTEIEEKLTHAVAAKGIVAIGETGLDKKSDSHFGTQLKVFKLHIAFAEKNHLPIVIHCVGSWQEIIAATKNFSAPKIIHGFWGNIELAKQLYRQGFLFSVGAAILNPRSKIREAVSWLPTSVLFCETDEQNIDIGKIYHEVGALKNIATEQLKADIYCSFNKLIKQNNI